MSKPDEFPQSHNTKKGIEARKAELLKDQRERALFRIFEKFYPLEQERHSLDFYEFSEWENFFQKLTEIIKNLLLLDFFRSNQELKKECEEVLLLLDKEDTSQSRKYSDLINKLFEFFINNKIFIQPKLP